MTEWHLAIERYADSLTKYPALKASLIRKFQRAFRHKSADFINAERESWEAYRQQHLEQHRAGIAAAKARVAARRLNDLH